MSAKNGGLPGCGVARPVRKCDSAQMVKNRSHAAMPSSVVEYPKGWQESFAASCQRALIDPRRELLMTLHFGLSGISRW